MTVPLEVLPKGIQAACRDLRNGLQPILGEELVALWVYGAVTFEDRPRRLGDVDTHAVVRSPVSPKIACAIDELHESTSRDRGVEWDSWYILERDAGGSAPPPHAFRVDFVDRAWALHRAHWLAGQYVLLSGPMPSDLVRAPSWPELEDGLRNELQYIEHLVQQGPIDTQHAAFVVWNGCRIICSLRTRNVVVSKRAASHWALENLPDSWSAAVHAAERAYDAKLNPDDDAILQESVPLILAAVRKEFACP